jgi:hypothetical protein
MFHYWFFVLAGVFLLEDAEAMRIQKKPDVSSYVIDYSAEVKAALEGQKWYDASLIPTLMEIEGRHSSPFKIRLPLDLNRIFEEYQQLKKPVSLAVSCGDQEIPWRSYFAAKSNDDSRPQDQDFWQHLGKDKIDYSLLNENFISIDPLLGISGYPNSTKVDSRGAGHIYMDAMNSYSWKKFADFLKQNGVKLYQIIYTAGMGDSISRPEHHKEDLQVHLGMLVPGGRLVQPYFLNCPEGAKEWVDRAPGTFFRLQRLGRRVNIQGIVGTIFYSPEESSIEIPKTKDLISTHHSAFFDLVNKKRQGEDISKELKQRIEERLSGTSPAYQDFIFKVCLYYFSIMKPDLSQLLKGQVFFAESYTEQLKKTLSLMKSYYKELGLNLRFLTSKKIAVLTGAPNIIEDQKWKPGDYPYGEREHIAMVVEKE